MLARSLAGFDIRPIDDELGRRAGILLGAAGTTDVLDAAVVLLSSDGDEILTAHVSDLRPLAEAADRHVDLIEV